MDKQPTRFYYITICLILALFSINVLIKTGIWRSALKDRDGDCRYALFIRRGAAPVKYTTQQRQKVFNSVDYLLRPAFVMAFVLLAVKLIKTADIFELKDNRNR